MSVEIYDALRDAGGVSEEKARKAAEAAAGIGDGFAAMDAKMDTKFAGVDAKFAGVDAKFAEVNAKLDTLAQQLDRLADMPQRMAKLEGIASNQPSVWQMITFIAASQVTLLGFTFLILRFAAK
jgi:hypothetical protein